MQHRPTSQRPGRGTFMRLASRANTLTCQMASGLASVLASHVFFRPSLPLIIRLLPYTARNLMTLFKLSSKRGVILAPSLVRKSSPLLGPSKLLHLASFPNQDDRGNSESSRTCRRRIPRATPSRPSTARLTPISTHAHGVLSLLSASLYGASPQDPRQLYAMSRRPTGPSPSNQTNGLGSLSGSTRGTVLRLTHEIVLAWHQVVAFTAAWVMQAHKSCARVASGPFLNGSMITFSSGFYDPTWRNTTSGAGNGRRTSQETAESSTTVAVSGSRALSCLMISLRSLMRMRPSLSVTYRKHLKGSFPF